MTTSSTSTSTTSSTSSTSSTTSSSTSTSSTTTTLAPITSSNLYTNVFKHIYTIVNTNVTDPKIATRNKWIWTTMPDTEIDGKDFYPVIVIGTVDNLETPLLTLSQKRANPDIYVEFYCTNKEQRDTLSDTFNAALLSNKDTIGGYNMEYMEISSSNDEFQHSKFTVYQRRFRLEFISEGF